MAFSFSGVLAGGVLLAAVGSFGFGAVMELDPPLAGDRRPIFISADGVMLDSLGEPLRPPLRVRDYPKVVVDAIKLSEDRTFDRNFGWSLRGKVRALWRDIQCFCLAEGGSSTTEQLIKLRVTGKLSRLARTAGVPRPVVEITRKAIEPFIAMGVTIFRDKNEIMAAYMRTAPFSGGTLGVEAAARRCWNKPVSALSLNDAVLLAVALPAPSNFKCGRGKGVSERGRDLLDAMVKTGTISAAERKRVKRSPARKIRVAPHSTNAWYVDLARADLPEGSSEEIVDLVLNTGLQQAVQRAVAREAGKLRNTQVAVVAMRLDGAVIASLGGKWPPQHGGGYDRAVFSRRAANSTVKMAGLLALLRTGKTLDDIVHDAPFSCEGYNPGNPDGQYLGAITLRDAFAASRNMPWISELCFKRDHAWLSALEALGLPAPRTSEPATLIGAFEVSLQELTGSVAAIVGGRGPVTPYRVAARRPRVSGRDPIPEAGAICEAMRAVVTYGTGRAADVGVGTIGKTGTGPVDAYFVGAVGDLVIGVRVGPDKGGRVRTMGGGIPARIFAAIATDAKAMGVVRHHRCGSSYNPDR